MKPKHKNGFTLIEILVSIGILGFISVIVVEILFSVMRINAKTNVSRHVKQEGEYALEVMSRMIQGSSKVEMNCAEEGAELPVNTQARITMPGGEVIFLSCYATTKERRIASISAYSMTFLTSNKVTLDDDGDHASCSGDPLKFTCTSIGGIPNTVTISFRLRQAGEPLSIFEKAKSTFQTTVNLRNAR